MAVAEPATVQRDAPPRASHADVWLRVQSLAAGYGGWPVLSDVGFELRQGETLGILGHNGAGKTTLLRCLAGTLGPSAGNVAFEGEDVSRWSVARRVRSGIVLVPQGRALFREMSIRDNVLLGAFCRPADAARAAWKDLSSQWALLGQRQNTLVGKLSGGQQQIVANARGLASRPRLLMIDEPSIGLSGVAVTELAGFLEGLRDTGMTTILVEQNIGLATRICDRFLVLRHGQMVGIWRKGELPLEDLWKLF